MQLTKEANIGSLCASGSASPQPSRDSAETESEETANLALILKEFRDVGKEVKEFRQDTNNQLQDIRGELDKTNARLCDV